MMQKAVYILSFLLISLASYGQGNKITLRVGADSTTFATKYWVGSQNFAPDSNVFATRYWSGTQYALFGHNHDEAYAPISGSGYYIQNQSAAAQTGSLWVSNVIKQGNSSASEGPANWGSWFRGRMLVGSGTNSGIHGLGTYGILTIDVGGGVSTGMRPLSVMDGTNERAAIYRGGGAWFSGNSAIGTAVDVNYRLKISGFLGLLSPMQLANSATAPTILASTNGWVYYNSTSHKFIGYRNGAWVNFLMDGDVTGTGEANTASNLGAGVGVFAQKSGVDLQFKSLVPGTNIGVTNDANAVTISAPSDLTTFTPRYSAGSGMGDVNVAIPVGQLYYELGTITASNNLTVGLSTSSTSAGQTLHHVIANTNTNATYNWEYSATVKKADGTTVTTIPNGKSHTLFYNGSYWMLTSEY